MSTAAVTTTAPRNAPRRRGTCPGVLAPMEVGDGMLVRVRVPCGVLPAAKAAALAELGQRFGNGLIDLSHRGNLQLRGVPPAEMPALIEELRVLGYVSTDAASEAVRNVMVSPAAGLDETEVLDVRPYALALDARLAEDESLHRLPAKFGWLICGGGRLPLTGSSTDVRFDAVATDDGPYFRVSLGGTYGGAAVLGFCRPNDLVAVAAAVAGAFLGLRETSPEPPRRMAGLVRAVGVEAIREKTGPLPNPPPLGGGGDCRCSAVSAPAPSPAQRGRVGEGAATFLASHPHYLPVAFPFGRLTCATLAELAKHTPELRLTPWRALLLADPAPTAEAAARARGGILDPADVRLKVTACSGITGCDVGTTDTHADGLAIAQCAAGLLAGVRMVHVSGCAKGCAHPAAADVTLTARDGVYDIALNAVPGAEPWRSGLSPAEAVAAVCSLSIEELSSGA